MLRLLVAFNILFFNAALIMRESSVSKSNLRLLENSLSQRHLRLIKEFVEDKRMIDLVKSSGKEGYQMRALFTLLQLVDTLPDSHFSRFSLQETATLKKLASLTARFAEVPLLQSYFKNTTDFSVLLSTLKKWVPVPVPIIKPIDKTTIGCKIDFVGNKSEQTHFNKVGQSARWCHENWITETDCGPGDGIVNPGTVFHPGSDQEVLDVIKQCNDIVVMGTGHTIGYALGSRTGGPVCQLSTWNFKRVSIDHCASTITVGSGVVPTDVTETLAALGKILSTWIVHKDVTIVGQALTGAQGLMQAQHRNSLANYLISMTVINGKGQKKIVQKNSAEGRGWSFSLGSMGVIVEATFELLDDYLAFETCWVKDGDPIQDYASAGLDIEDPGSDTDLWMFYNGSPFQPTLLGCALTHTTKNLSATEGLTINNDEVDGRSMIRENYFDNHLEIYRATEKFVFALIKDVPGLKKNIYETWGPYPTEDTPMVRQMSIEMRHGFGPAKFPRDQSIWGALYIQPRDGLMAYRMFLKHTRNECQHDMGLRIGLLCRAWPDDSPPLLGQVNAEVQGRPLFEVFWTSWTYSREAIENWSISFICSVRCTANITFVEFHFGEFFPRALTGLAGWKYPSTENIKKFKAIELAEDPDDKFGNALSNDIGLRLRPEAEHICSYCSRVDQCT